MNSPGGAERMQDYAKKAIYILVALLAAYLVLLKTVPVVFGSLTIALIFSLVVDGISE